MRANILLPGEYQVQGNQLKKGDLVLHVGERKKPTGPKTKQFLRQIKPEFTYISNLYPLNSGEYMFDFTGNKYRLVYIEEGAKIIQL